MEEKDYLSKQNTNCLKGILAIVVLIHHLYQFSGLSGDTFIGEWLQLSGCMAVAIFFFLSGYGLSVSYARKGQTYLQSFPRKRILSFYCQYLLVLLIYTIYTLCIDETQNWTVVFWIKTFTFGGTIIHNGWYLQVILLLYIVFWVTYCLVKSSLTKFLIIGIFLCLFCIGCDWWGLSSYWYEGSFSFLIGLIFGSYRKKIDAWMSKKWIWIISIILVAVSFGIVAYFINNPIFIGYHYKLLKIVFTSLFTVFAFLLIMRLNVECMITRWVGMISFEIYVIHGLFMSLYHVMGVSSFVLYAGLVVISSFIAALLISPIFRFVSKMVSGQNVTKKVLN